VRELTQTGNLRIIFFCVVFPSRPCVTFLIDILSALLYDLYIKYNTGDDIMPTKISTADARKKFSNIVKRVAFGKESIILTRRGEELAAMVAMDELRLLQELEDRIDIADAMKAIKEPGEDIPAEQFWKKLGL